MPVLLTMEAVDLGIPAEDGLHEGQARSEAAGAIDLGIPAEDGLHAGQARSEAMEAADLGISAEDGLQEGQPRSEAGGDSLMARILDSWQLLRDGEIFFVRQQYLYKTQTKTFII
jgi:hypothetical protein